MFGLLRDRLWETDDVFWHRGEYERCIAATRLITQIDPHDIDAYDSTAWLMQNQLRDDEAEAFLLEGLKNNPDTYDMYFNLGYFCYMHERFEESVTYLEQSAGFGAPIIPVWHLLAHAHELAGRPDESLSIWLQMEALELDQLVPVIQIERILRGEPATNIPRAMSHSREERKRQQLELRRQPESQ